MSEGLDSDPPFAVDKESEPKKKKGKKRPSDFEIVRTILTRTHERKLPYLLKGMGEDPDILFFCSKAEEEFTYGSPDIAIAIFEISDPELSTMIQGFLNKLYGLRSGKEQQLIINVRDQFSELAKTKGESIDVEIEENDFGSAWTVRKDVRGQERTQYFAQAIDSLFHMQMVRTWCKEYRPLLTTQDPAHLYYDYAHPEGDTGAVISLPMQAGSNHPMAALYPHGFRAMVTRGIDVILNKFLQDIPYPIISEEMIVFQEQSASCQMAHRIIAEGWRMILLRPNAVFFPTFTTPLPFFGTHTL